MIIFGSTGTHIDKIIIMPLLGAAVLGNYSLGLQVLVLFTALSSILYKFILPQDSTRRSTHKIKKYLFLTSIGISVLGFFSLPIIMVELFPEYNEATNAIQILSLDIVPTSLLVIFVSKFLSLEKSGIILISSGLGLVTMILGVFTLGVNYEMAGLFLTWVLSTTVNVTILILYYKKLGYSFSQL
jgi:O-antigen/teichoic acid export membrane protein